MSFDYGRGVTNIDHETDIRYGVISQHSILQAWADSSTGDYGPPHCPKCGDKAEDISVLEVDDVDTEGWEQDYGDNEYACQPCCYLFNSDSAFGDEPLDFVVDDDEYVMNTCLSSDIMIIKSPYYTYAPFCSPCVPGAGDLDTAGDHWRHCLDMNNFKATGIKTYCVGHGWFDDGHAPYPVFRVSDDWEVAAPALSQ